MRKIVVAVAASALLTAAVGAVVIASRDQSAEAKTGAPALLQLQKVATVASDASNTEITFRGTPTVPTNNGDRPNDMLTVPSRTNVTVRCIADDTNPHRSGKWYYVTLAGAPYPAVSAYVWGNLVRDAPPVPACTADLVEAHPRLPGTLTLSQGPANGKAYWYAITLRGFHPRFEYTVGCYDDHMAHHLESTAPFRTFQLRTDGTGYAFTDTSCFSGEGERHWVEVGPYASDDVEWTAPPPPSTPAPALTVTARPSARPSHSTTPPEPSAPPSRPTAETRVTTVQNQVTNGATAMREDSTPAYLSIRPAPFCKRDGCAVGGTDMGTGATITVLCQTGGPRMTNGHDGSSVDDSNPGLVTSSLWYRARSGDGREGFISEVYIRPGDRGGVGLPTCP